MTQFSEANKNKKKASDARRIVSHVRRKKDSPAVRVPAPVVITGNVTTLGDLLNRWLEQDDAARKLSR